MSAATAYTGRYPIRDHGTLAEAGTRMGVTRRQALLLSYVVAHQAANGGASPSYQEIADALGLASKSSVARLVKSLIERGRLRKINGRDRCLEVIEAPPIAPALHLISTPILRAELARRGAL